MKERCVKWSEVEVGKSVEKREWGEIPVRPSKAGGGEGGDQEPPWKPEEAPKKAQRGTQEAPRGAHAAPSGSWSMFLSDVILAHAK